MLILLNLSSSSIDKQGKMNVCIEEDIVIGFDKVVYTMMIGEEEFV